MTRLSPERRQILDVLADGREHTPAGIATKINKMPSTVNKLLLALLEQGHVIQTAYGVYALPSFNNHSTEQPDRGQGDPGVYILRNGTYYKIGKSSNVKCRVAQLRTALPQETVHVHTITTDHPDEVERMLHIRYAAKRVRGEWFALDMFDVDELCQMGDEPLHS